MDGNSQDGPARRHGEGELVAVGYAGGQHDRDAVDGGEREQRGSGELRFARRSPRRCSR
jgi:hypothetical protein